MEAQAALEGSARPVVLDPVATKREDRAVVGVDGNLDVDLAVRIGQKGTDVPLQLEDFGSVVDIPVDRFREGGRHPVEVSQQPY